MPVKTFFLPLVLFLTCMDCFGQATASDSAFINQFNHQLQTDTKKDDLHGSISAAIVKDDKIIWAGAVGYAYPNRDVLADSSTIYRIGSITKTFTAVILMQLVQEKKLSLDDPVEKYVPETRNLKGYPGNTTITLRQLASHTAGLNRDSDTAGAWVGPPEEWENRLLACIPYTSLQSDPGTRFLYSNIGYSILGLALQRATGVPYMQLVQQRIFIPLHMDNTFFSIAANKAGKIAGSIGTIRENALSGYSVPCGGIYSTAPDLAKFAIALMGKTAVLQPESVKEMQVIPPAGQYYGLGLMLGRLGKLDFIGHGGTVNGYNAYLSIEQHNVYAVILLRNYTNGRTNLVVDSRKLLSKLSKG